MLRLLAFLLLTPVVLADCPADSFKYPSLPPSKCYYFMTVPATYTGAYETCKNISGNLVSLHDRFTDSFLGDKGATIFNGGATDFWIGASGVSFTDWLWSDGSSTDYQDWGPFTPSGTCGIKRITDQYWNLVDCSQKKPYVCEMNEIFPSSTPITTSTTTVTTTTTTPQITTTSTIQPNCSFEWFYYEETNSCYYWTNKYNWSAAENYCVKNDAHLASIHSYDELNFLKYIYNGELWIGLRGSDNYALWNTSWQWSDGTALDYSRWSGGMPTTGSQTCVSATTSFINTDCSSLKYGLCKKPSANLVPTVASTTPTHSDCSEGWTYYEPTNSCYFFKKTDTLTWEGAEEYCAVGNAHLVSIHSYDEMNFLISFAPYYPWIGLSAKTSPIEWNTTWSWTDNTVLDYQKWGYWDMPSLDSNLCVYLSTDGFRNADCKWATPYAVCKKPSNTPTSPASLTPSTPAPICPSGWTYYEPTNSCFSYSSKDLYNWTAAEEYCAFKGGHLASIHNAEEASFAYSLLSNYKKWIGLYTKDTSVEWNSTWYWTDNTEVDYLSWIYGIPSLDGQLCTYLTPNFFKNYLCSTSMKALCKKPSSITPTLTPTSPTPTAPAQKCPKGWDYFAATNSCFVRTLSTFNFTTVNQYCDYYDSKMASIHNLDEYNFLRKYIPSQDYLWIGLYSDTNAIMWKWTDGSDFDYPYWASGYPVRGSYTCGSIYYSNYGFTNAKPCNSNFYGICKRPASQI